MVKWFFIDVECIDSTIFGRKYSRSDGKTLERKRIDPRYRLQLPTTIIASIMVDTELDVLREVSLRLESAGIAFMLTGSMAMNYYVQPRMTRDIDLVVKIAADQIDLVVAIFEEDYYVDRVAISRALAQRSLFNIIHNKTIIKLDCIVLKNNQYRQEEFSRRKQITFRDFQTWIVSREDLIL